MGFAHGNSEREFYKLSRTDQEQVAKNTTIGSLVGIEVTTLRFLCMQRSNQLSYMQLEAVELQPQGHVYVLYILR